MPTEIINATSPTPPISTMPPGVQNSFASVDTAQRGYEMLRRTSPRANGLFDAHNTGDLTVVAIKNEVGRKRYSLRDQLMSETFHLEHAKKTYERANGPNGHIARKVVTDADGKEKTVEVNALEAQEASIARLKASLRALDEVETDSEITPGLLDQLGRQNVNRTWRDVDLSGFEPKDGETDLEFLERKRAIVDALAAQEKKVFKAPRTVDEVKANIARDLDGLENDGRPRLNDLRRGWHVKHSGKYSTADAPDAAIAWPATRTGAIQNYDDVTVDDAVPLMIWLFRDQVQKRLFELAESYGDKDAMSEAEKNATLAKIRSDLWTAKHAEEVAIRRCKAASIDVKRREFDFRILLSIE